MSLSDSSTITCKMSGYGVAQRLCNGLSRNDPGVDLSQGTVNGGAVSK